MQVKHLVVGFSLALAGCGGGDVTAPTVGASGSLSFSFTGATGANTYNASGALPASTTTTLGTTSWAAGAKDNTNQSLDVVASVPRSSTTWDLVTITIPQQTPGTNAINPSCTANVCTELWVFFGSTLNDTNFQYYCTLTTGSVTVSAISATRASGTFTGSGSCFASTGGSTPFSVTNGAFDVGLSATTLP